MPEITVMVGSRDVRTRISFAGERLGECVWQYDPDGPPAIYQRTTDTLYRTADGRLMVHQAYWTCWPGEPDVEVLRSVERSELAEGEWFGALGAACGFWQEEV